MNKCIFLGRLTKDPECRYTQTGKCVTSFTLAMNNGKDRPATFLPFVAWEALGEIAGNNLKKGSQILVESRAQVRSYDAQDGSKRYITEFVVINFEFCGSKQQTGQSNDSGAGQFGTEVLPDEEIPF